MCVFKYVSLSFLLIVLFVLTGATLYPTLKAGHAGLQKETKQTAAILGEEKNVAIPSLTEIPTTGESKTAGQSVFIGFWTEGLWDDSTKTLHPERLQELEKNVGKKMAIAHIYRGWDALSDLSLISDLRVLDSKNWRPMISVNPYFFDNCKSTGATLYKTISLGNCDVFLTSAANNLRSFGKPLFLRFAWEMNSEGMEWGIIRSKDSADDFIGAWRRIYSILRNGGASNVLMVFSPNVGSLNTVPIETLYPGDAYTDWVALDGYNWGTTQSWSTWQSFSQVFSSSYKQITAIAPSKPLMIAEVNSTDQGGDKALWYSDMLLSQIPKKFQQIGALVFYNEDRTSKEHVNWLVDVTSESLNAFKAGIHSESYISSY